MTLGVHQPYFVPYIGYFQLINAVDKFVVYDDVSFIKQGYINRNSICSKTDNLPINLLVAKISSNKKIVEHQLINDNRWKSKLVKKIGQCYAKAPYYKDRIGFVSELIVNDSLGLSDYLTIQLEDICRYIGITTEIVQASQCYNNSNLERAERLIDLCQIEETDSYINAIGGKELYSKDYFRDKGIELKFLKTDIKPYKQFSDDFKPYQSIIDILMFNTIDEIKLLLNDYQLL